MIEILHRYAKAAMYRSETAETVAQAVSEAVKAKANLSGADLSGADLSGADLSGADMSSADLSGAKLSYSNLSGAKLRSADLSGANLNGANLRSAKLNGADLSGANLRSADLSGANLRSDDLSGADLSYSNLSGADLSGSKLSGVNLSGSEGIPQIAAAQTVIAPEGHLIGWKKCLGGVIVKLRIPEDAKRSNGTGRKCRAEFVDVLEVIGAGVGLSTHDGTTKYIAGTRVTCDTWCDDRWQECAGGIHFFITREEAENY